MRPNLLGVHFEMEFPLLLVLSSAVVFVGLALVAYFVLLRSKRDSGDKSGVRGEYLTPSGDSEGKCRIYGISNPPFFL